MSDTSAPAGGPADPNAPAPQPAALRVMSQYVRDLSFENPGNLTVQEQPGIDLGIDVSAQPHASGPDVYEVALKLAATAKAGDQPLFVTELDYAGVFQLQGIAEDQIEPMLLIECPRLLFPFARRIVAEITREGGFPPLLIDPVDFVSLYQQQKAREAAPSQPQA